MHVCDGAEGGVSGGVLCALLRPAIASIAKGELDRKSVCCEGDVAAP
eukprot:COSAG02_NODE_56057_length_287_cov_0.829787_1_plen_46_part_01